MTSSAPTAATSSEYRRALRQVLQLVLGECSQGGSVDWALAFQIAEAERLAALAWHRRGEVIRRSAPASVIDRWRALAMRVALQAEQLVAAVASAVDVLRSAGVRPVLVKGPTLAQRLYGDPTVRPLADCDLFIPLQQRAVASEALLSSGWTSRIGEPPGEETFERWAGGQRNVIEVHSAIVDDPLLGHLRIPVEHTDIRVGPWTLPAQSGDYLAGSLAAHLAKHETAPMLWVVDFHTLWSQLSVAERARAVAAARTAGVSRHLKWATGLATALSRASAGEPEAFEELARLQRAIGDMGRVSRLVHLSENPLDAMRVVAGRIWPEEWRDNWMRLPNYVARRAAGWIARKAGLAGPHAPNNSAARALAVDETSLASLLEETLGRGLAVWIRPRGTSMEPAIPASAQAHIVPVASRPVQVGDVVLARLRHGQFVLHRVVRVVGQTIQLKGDAMRRRDDLVAMTAIVGICDRVEIGGVLYKIEDRPRDNVALLTSAARRRLSRLIARRS